MGVPLPPLDEQRRIATILDKADALRCKRKRALEILDGLTQSIFLDIFGDPLRDGPRWSRIAPLSKLADIGSGITKGRKLNGSATRSVPYLAVANVQDKALDLSAVKTIDATDDEIARYRLEADDLLLTEGGDPDKLGRGTLWSGEIPEMIHQNHVFRVRVTSDQILPLYLNWLVGSSYGKAYFLRLAKQTTGIASINKTQLSEFPVIVPPLDKQRLFVERAKAVSIVAAHQSSLANHIKTLFSSLQHRAFAGELL